MGRKQHVLVDTLGLMLTVVVHAAAIHDYHGLEPVFRRSGPEAGPPRGRGANQSPIDRARVRVVSGAKLRQADEVPIKAHGGVLLKAFTTSVIPLGD